MAEQTSLRAICEERGFDFGAAASAHLLRRDAHFKKLLRTEFTAVTAENSLKMENLRPEPDVYDFGDADAVVNFGRANDMTVRGHTLVWHNQTPAWFTEWDHTDDQIREFLREHVHTVAGRYRDTVDVWDVVNEAVVDDGSMRETVWYDALGEEYLDLAFQWANEVAPDADLFYNDYDADGINAKSDGIYALLERLLDRGVPIDGVGLQMHAFEDRAEPDSIAENIRRFQDLGLEVHVTEMDVAYDDATDPGDVERRHEDQAEYYRDVVDVCLATGVDTLVVWGVRDTDSWLTSWFDRLTDDPLLFDGNNDPKPAYHAVKERLAAE